MIAKLQSFEEEIARAVTPIVLEDINGNKYFKINKPFKYKNSQGKEFDYFYVKVTLVDSEWRMISIPIPKGLFFRKRKRLEALTYINYKLEMLTFIDIQENTTKISGGSETPLSEVIFYGGWYA